MPEIVPSGVGAVVETDPTALKILQNLADLDDVPTARTNLGLGSAAVLNAGSGSGDLLRTDGDASGLSNLSPTTTLGDLIRRGASADERLPIGTEGYLLTVVSGQPAWQAGPSGGGTTQGAGANTYALTINNDGGAIPGSVAGNARGENSVDLQSIRLAATDVASGLRSVVVGGFANAATAAYAAALGGYNNKASGLYSLTIGGDTCIASQSHAVCVGGDTCTASGASSFVGGGTAVQATASYSVAVGGLSNVASGLYSGVLSGQSNVASGTHSSVLGGTLNTAPGPYCTSWGYDCEAGFGASYSYCTAWGQGSRAYNSHATAFGKYARADTAGGFAWSPNGVAQGEECQTEFFGGTIDTAGNANSLLCGYISTNNSAFFIQFRAIAITPNGDDAAKWTDVEAFFVHDGTVQSIQTVSPTAPDQTRVTSKTPANWRLEIVNDAGVLKVNVQGEAATNIRWYGWGSITMIRGYT